MEEGDDPDLYLFNKIPRAGDISSLMNKLDHTEDNSIRMEDKLESKGRSLVEQIKDNYRKLEEDSRS